MSAREAPAAGAAKTWRAELVATLALSWPMVLINLTQAGLGATDVLMLARLSPEALAAGSLGSNMFFVCYVSGLGLISAIAAMIAAERGRNRHAVREVRRSFRQGLWSAVAIAIPVWATLWRAEDILILFGQDPALAAAAGAYLRAAQWALLPMLWFVALRFFLAGMERPVPSLVVGVAGLGVNALANYALIFGGFGAPALGLVGAGVATTLTAWFMFLALAVFSRLDRRVRRYALFGRFWRADWPRFFELWRLGAPIAATILFEVSIFTGALLIMGLISADALAAHTIAIQIAALAFMVPLGLGQAATVRVGLAFGARDAEGVARAGWTAFALGTGFMGFTALLMIGAPELLIGAFLPLDDPSVAPVVALAVSYLALAALFQLADGGQAVGAGMLRGLHDTRTPMLYALVGYWGVGFPLSLGLGLWTPLEGVGVWIGLAGGLAVVAALMLARWIRREANGLSPRPRPSLRAARDDAPVSA